MLASLPAKICAPQIDQHVKRTHLFGLLDHSQTHKRLTWIHGPGGAGKTTLLKSYLDTAGIKPLWYQVDARDIDPASLFHYLSIAAHKDFLISTELPEARAVNTHAYTVYAANYFEALFALLPKPFVLVFDNCQDTAGDAVLFDMIKIAHDQLPIEGHIYCISREKPPAIFAALRAKQSMSLIDETQLRFSEQEVYELVKIHHNDAPELNIKQLLKKTLGWAAGLTILLNDATLTSLDDFADTDYEGHLLFDYFYAEYFHHLPESAKHSLLSLAFLPRISSRAATAITQDKNAARLLGEFERKNFFTHIYSLKPLTYQFHPLFREFLLTKAKQTFAPELLSEKLKLSAELLFEQDELEEGIAALIEADEPEVLCDIIEKHAVNVLNSGRFKTISSWIAQVPKTLIASRPWLIYWHGISLQPFQPVDAYAKFQQAFDLFHAQKDQLGLIQSWMALPDAVTFSLGNYHIFDTWLELFEQRIGSDFVAPNDELDAKLTKCMLNIFCFRPTTRAHLDIWIARGESLLSKPLEDNLRLQLGCRLFHTYFNLGLLDKERFIFDSIDKIGLGSDALLPAYKILWRVYRTAYGWHSNAPSITKESIKQGIDIANQSQIHALDGVLYAMGAIHGTAINDTSMADTFLANLDPGSALSSPLHLSMYYLATGSKALIENRYDDAIQSLSQSVKTMRDNGGVFPQIQCQMVLTQALIESGKTDQALNHLQEMTTLNERPQSDVVTFYLHILQARLYTLQGDVKKGLNAFDHAMALCASRQLTIHHCGFNPFIIADLCWLKLKTDGANPTVESFIKTTQLPKPKDADHRWPFYCKILTLGDFNIAIGDDHHVSLPKAKPLALLEILIAMGGRQVPQERISECLWPDADGDAAHSAFTTTLHRLRKALGRDDLFVLSNKKLSLNPDLVWVDVLDVFQNAPSHAASTLCEDGKARLQALCRGDFLSHSDEPWAFETREKLQSLLSKQKLDARFH